MGQAGPAKAEDADSLMFYVRPVAAVLMGLHGLVHLMGMQLLWKMGEPAQFTYADAVPSAGTTAGYAVGALWALACALFLVAALLGVTRRPAWKWFGIPAALISGGVVGLNVSMARIAMAIDVIVLLVAAWSIYRERHPRGAAAA